MVEATERFTEVVDFLAVIAPTTANGQLGAHVTGYINLADYHRVFAELVVGQPAGASTIDMTFTQATSAAGANAKILTIGGVANAKDITQIVAGDIGVHVGVEIRPEELDVTGLFCFLQAQVTVGTAVYTYTLVVMGLCSRYEPVGVTDFAEIIT